jgi:hypothetical protein
MYSGSQNTVISQDLQTSSLKGYVISWLGQESSPQISRSLVLAAN